MAYAKLNTEYGSELLENSNPNISKQWVLTVLSYIPQRKVIRNASILNLLTIMKANVTMVIMMITITLIIAANLDPLESMT